MVETLNEKTQNSFEVYKSILLSIPENNGIKKIQVRFIQVNGINLEVPIIDTQEGINSSKEFQDRVKKLVGFLDRAQCTPDPIGFFRSCGFYDAKDSTGTERGIYRDNSILDKDSKVSTPQEFSKILGIEVTTSNPEYVKYREILHSTSAYTNDKTFMTGVADWLTKISKK